MAKNKLEKPKSLYSLYVRKGKTQQQTTHYCSGCGHGTLQNLIAEAIDDLGIQDNTIFISPVGCSVFAYWYFDVGNLQTAHGRAPAAATGLKRTNPNSMVICYQGDGDLAAIGTTEIIHAANRGENFTVIFVNNAIYGMTGGQLAPTTLVGSKTTTTPYGRSAETDGYPLRVCELLNTLEKPVYIARTTLTSTKEIMNTRKAIRTALEIQKQGLGFSLVEVLSPCPTGWKTSLEGARKYIDEVMSEYFPLGVFRDKRKDIRQHEEIPVKELESLLAEPPVDESQVKVSAPKKGLPQSLIISGQGGQGSLFLGVLLAEAGHLEGRKSSWLPEYGPEQRGGTANCGVVLSDNAIGSPFVSEPDVLIAMNQPSLDRFESAVKPGGMIIYNSSLIKREVGRTDVKVIAVPATDIAQQIGDPKASNMALLGALLKKTGIVSYETIQATLKRGNKASQKNLDAILKGMDAAQAE